MTTAASQVNKKRDIPNGKRYSGTGLGCESSFVERLERKIEKKRPDGGHRPNLMKLVDG
jgi:hypothetical protein